MTTDVDLEGIEVLSTEECRALLAAGCVGRIAFVVGERPHLLPLNYAADQAGVVVFRTSASSILMAVAGRQVVFEIDGLDYSNETGWSVCAHGIALEITDAEDPVAVRLRRSGTVTWAPGRRERWFAITPERADRSSAPRERDARRLRRLVPWHPGVIGRPGTVPAGGAQA